MTEEPQRPSASGVPGGYPSYAAGGPPAGGRRIPVPPPPRESWRRPRRVDPVPGTPFGLVHLDVPPITSGPAVTSLATGIASVLVALVVACFGVVGAGRGWGGWVAGAFALLGILLGVASVMLALLGRRQIRRTAGGPGTVRFTGRRLATAGLVCGAIGLGLTLIGLLVAVLLQVT